MFVLSAGTLAFEIDLTRLFSVAQFYHFAFMIVSIALLGFGASGTALAVLPGLRMTPPARQVSRLSLATAVCMTLAFAVLNCVPFDSFSIAWDRRQLLVLILDYIALAAPFLFSGMALGILLDAFPGDAGITYGANLLGSAVGCLLALAGPARLGGEGMVVLSTALAVLGALAALPEPYRSGRLLAFPSAALLALCFVDLGIRVAGGRSLSVLELRTSPYKGLSYALQAPGSSVIYRQWNAFSRIDVVHSDSIHTVPGLSYRFDQPIPAMDGLLVDGDDLSPVVDPAMDTRFVGYLPNAVAFHLRPAASTLILEPRGGLDVLTALALTSGSVAAVEPNSLIVSAAPVYRAPRVQAYVETERSYVRRTRAMYDVIVLSLASSFHPVRSGAYALAEDYRYTTESFKDMLAHLAPNGLLVATRWLQDPPSEDLRLFALALSAVQDSGPDAANRLLAFRGFNTATVLVRNGGFSEEELSSIRGFLAERAFDLTYAPDIWPDETNRYNILPRSLYYETYTGLLHARPQEGFYAAYDYDVRPPSDNHPFFGHFFKWAQAPKLIAELGRAWQPFGGAGYFVILALLGLAVIFAAVLILMPLAAGHRSARVNRPRFALRPLLYFGLLGFAFLFVEIPLVQGFILYFGQAAYAFTAVLFSLLFFSGIGSRCSARIPLRIALAALVLLILAAPTVLSVLFARTLGLHLILRLMLAAVVLSPLGFLMGIPFPAAIRAVSQELGGTPEDRSTAGDIPWIWAVNGAASVVASILAALLALAFGFQWVLRSGALCYGGALLTAWGWIAARPGPSAARS